MSVHVTCSGLTRRRDLEEAVTAGVDYIGLRFVDGPSGVTEEEASSLALAAREAGFEGGLVGIFVDSDPEVLERGALSCDLDVLQLHGDETPEMVRAAAQIRPVWKTLRVDGALAAGRLEGEAVRHRDAEVIVVEMASALAGAGMNDPGVLEGMRRLVAARRVVVAGALGVEDVAGLVRELDPYGVDLSASLGGAGGIEALVAAVRGAERSV